jgi:thiol-disulfide isomerase/thioredoxin
LAIFFALQVVAIRRDWSDFSRVTTPRGTEAPDLTLPLLDGGTLHVAGERGHPLVLVFWASWCGPCMHELPGVERVQKRLGGHRARIVAVNTEGNRDAALEVRDKLGLTMPIAIDDGSGSSLYRVSTIPHTVILDEGGRVAAVMGIASEDQLMSAIEDVEKRAHQ